MQHQPYETPNSNLIIGEETLESNFSTLNIWRKIYLVLIWVVTALLSVVFIIGAAESGNYGFAIGFVLFMSGLSYWTHWAITKRNVGHITALAILNLIPGGNIIGCLIMFSIRRVTINERKKYQIN